MTTAAQNQQVILRTPELTDAPQLYQLVGSSKPLAQNSPYLYLLLCHHFADTCVVASIGDKIVGMTTAYLIPEKTDVLFIWQIAVSPDVRKRGLAQAMLRHLLKRKSCRGVKYLEATVAPSNSAPQKLFKSLAEDLKAELHESELFPKKLFEAQAHEDEKLLRIGPLPVGLSSNKAS